MSKRSTTNLLVLLIIGFLLASRPLFAFLRTQGSEIVDGDGNEVLLRGMGLGGWLVPEGYILHTPGFGSPTSIRGQIVDVLGDADTDTFYELYHANYVNEKDMEAIASWGVNSIRLPFHYNMISPTPGVYLEEGFAVFDQVIEWCKRYDLWLILDMHCAPGGQNTGNISDSDGIEARLWTETAHQEHAIAIWREIARRYADEDQIAGYDLINEPVLPNGYPATSFRKVFMDITQAVREVDSNHIVFIEGNWYATDFNGLAPPWDANMVYSFHKYWSENTTASIQSFLNLRNTYRIPLWMGEAGENSNTWFFDAIQLLEDNNIGWNWWTHKKVATLTSAWSAPLKDNYQQIIDYWDGKAAKPSHPQAKAALFEMARCLHIDSCLYHPDVPDAMFRSDFDSRSLPYKSHLIPGAIDCADYDMGRQGVAYFDQDYHRTRYDADQPWNTGWQYRNDGVDIEESGDSQGAEYSVGWTSTGEWIEYTVNVSQTGVYAVDFRVAANSSNGRLRLLADGRALMTNTTVFSTGGWYNWRTQTVPNLVLTQGTHTLRLEIVNEGFNINRMTFHLTSSVLPNGPRSGALRSFRVMPNYPNPFNGITRIPVELRQAQEVTVQIFDTRGSLVQTLHQGRMEAGQRLLEWDGMNRRNEQVASGIYHCRMQNENGSDSRPIIFQK